MLKARPSGDDTPRLKAAIRRARPDGVVLLGPGKFRVRSTIRLPAKVRMVGPEAMLCWDGA